MKPPSKTLTVSFKCLCFQSVSWFIVNQATRLTQKPQGHGDGKRVKNKKLGNTLAVQWLGLRAFTAEGPHSIPGRGTKIPQAVWHGQQKKMKRKKEIVCLLLSNYWTTLGSHFTSLSLSVLICKVGMRLIPILPTSPGLTRLKWKCPWESALENN